MKFITILTPVLLILILSSSMIEAEQKLNADTAKFEANLLVGIESENRGLRLSSAYQLGAIKSTKAVIPLLKILHNEKEECARIVAALALIKIGDARGVFAVKRAATFDDSERVKKMCRRFYNCYCRGLLAT